MKGKHTRATRWARKPQALVLLAAIALVVWSLLPASHPVYTAIPDKTVLSVLGPPHGEESAAPAPLASPSKRVDCTVVACLALTFDDGPDPVVTPRLLDILAAHHARATFFVLGVHVGGNEALLRRMHESGNEIGNHSWAHPHFPTLTPQQMQAEVSNTQAAIARADVPVPHIFRPPYGDINETVLANVPMTIVTWNIDPEDWNPKQYKHMLEHLATHARPGGVVVMHDTEPTTADNLDSILKQLEASHYTMVTVSELLNLTPGQPGLYYGRWRP